MAGSTLLVRCPVLIPEELLKAATQDQHLAVEAEQVFGYTVLTKAVEEKTAGVLTERRLLGLKLARALDHLGIDPFTKESVARYKAEQVKVQNAKVPLKHKEWFVRLVWWGMGSIGLGLAAVGCVCLSTGFIPYLITGETGLSGLLLATGCISFVLSFAVLAFMITMEVCHFIPFPRMIHAWKWERVRLNDYQKPIPQFALRKALQIARAVPEVEMYVDELVMEKWNGDPFLVAICGDCEEYFEVFDETRFERNL